MGGLAAGMILQQKQSLGGCIQSCVAPVPHIGQRVGLFNLLM